MTEKNEQTLDLPALREKARAIRLDILEMTTRAKSGHPSSSFSATDIVTALYFGGILRFRSDEPHWPERDRFIMSKGHAAPLLYAVLAQAGYFSRDELWRLREIDSPVQGHPIQDMMPGIEATTGSLGQGLSVGLGHILGICLAWRRRVRSRPDLGGSDGRSSLQGRQPGGHSGLQQVPGNRSD
jgi:transketolase